MLPDDSFFLRNETLRTIKDRHSVRTFTRNDVRDEALSLLRRTEEPAGGDEGAVVKLNSVVSSPRTQS